MKDKKQAISRMSLAAVGILALIAAGMTLWKLYQSGNLFDPSRMTLNDQFQENPILFSDQDPLDTQAGGENENDLLKQDPAAEDRQKPKQNPGIEDRLQETGADDAHQLVIGGEGQGAQIIIDPDSGNVIVRPDGDPQNGTEPSEKPDVDPIVDPDPVPELPPDIFEFWGTLPFPEEGLPAGSDQKLEISIYEGDLSLIYYGAVLNDWKLLCAANFYIREGGEIYRIEGYGENFEIGEYPPVALEDFSVEFRIRRNPQSPWQTITVDYTIQPYKIFVQNWQTGDYLASYSPGAQINLIYYYHSMMEQEGPLDNLFLGWSRDGKTAVNPQYVPDQPGRQVLLPLPLVKLDKNLEVYWKQDPDEDSFAFLESVQTLTGWALPSPSLVVPEGVQWVDLSASPDTVFLPQSVYKVSDQKLTPALSWSVDPENPALSSEAGYLYNKEKTELLQIPLSIKEVRVGEQVEKVNLSAGNQIQRLVLTSDQPPEMDLSQLHQAQIVVPSGAEWHYLSRWGRKLDDNQLVREDGLAIRYRIDGEALLSEDGTQLLGMLESAEGIVRIPENVVEILPGALENLEHVGLLLLPASVKQLDSGSIPANIPQIVSLGQAPEIQSDTFADATAVQVWVSAAQAESYRSRWASLLQEQPELLQTAEELTLKSEPDYEILTVGQEQILLSMTNCPAFLQAGDWPQAVTVIGSRAFLGNPALMVVEISESVHTLGRHAFAECPQLEGLVSLNTQKIIVQDQALEGAPKLHFAAFNAKNAEFSDGYRPSTAGFAPEDTYSQYEYPWSFSFVNQRYSLERITDAALLYGRGSAQDPDLLAALQATWNVTGEIELLPHTQGIDEAAFKNCIEPFTLTNMGDLVWIMDNAFENSGISGTLTLPESLEYIGIQAFADCRNLEAVWFPGSALTQIESFAFAGCTSLASVEFAQNSVMDMISEAAFANTALKTIELPASLTALGTEVFFECRELKEVVFHSPQPPMLVVPSYAMPFYFGDSLPDDFRVILADPALTQVYVDQWKTQLMGYGSLDEMTEEQQDEGEQRAWQLFGGQSVSPASAPTLPVPLEASSNEAEDMQKPEITPSPTDPASPPPTTTPASAPEEEEPAAPADTPPAETAQPSSGEMPQTQEGQS